MILNKPLNIPTIPSMKSLKPDLIPSPIFSNPNSLKIPPIRLPTIFTRPPISALNTPIIPSRNIPTMPSDLNPFIAPLIPPIMPDITVIMMPSPGINLATVLPNVNIEPAYPAKLPNIEETTEIAGCSALNPANMPLIAPEPLFNMPING